MAERKKKILIDFDGVIHRYNSGWQGERNIPDAPVIDKESGQDAIQWLRGLLQTGHFIIHIYSRRGSDPSKGGIGAMKVWLLKNGLEERYLKRIVFEKEKPESFLVIDDRCLQFKGKFFDPIEIKNFKPWWKE